jgi:hypothetical protein
MDSFQRQYPRTAGTLTIIVLVAAAFAFGSITGLDDINLPDWLWWVLLAGILGVQLISSFLRDRKAKRG